MVGAVGIEPISDVGKLAIQTRFIRLRLLHSSVLVYRRFCQESLQSGALRATGALYANLAKPYFARCYDPKLLIPRLGT